MTLEGDLILAQMLEYTGNLFFFCELSPLLDASPLGKPPYPLTCTIQTLLPY